MDTKYLLVLLKKFGQLSFLHIRVFAMVFFLCYMESARSATLTAKSLEVERSYGPNEAIWLWCEWLTGNGISICD